MTLGRASAKNSQRSTSTPALASRAASTVKYGGGVGAQADPFVGDGRVGGLDRVDRNEFGAPRLELAEADLDGVRIVVSGAAEHHEVASLLPVGLAEFPKRAADSVEPAGRRA